MDDLLLVPPPRSMRRLGGWVRVQPGGATVSEIEFTGATPNPEAYRLSITEIAAAGVAVQITAGTQAGIRHGRATLKQLERLRGGQLPLVEIQDEPAFAVRGVMLDVSRDRVPTMEHLRSTVELLASLKINHLQLYTEHTFAYAGHEAVWKGCSPFTPDEIRELDALCAGLGMELSANQNCFGHLHRWLALPHYAPLAEVEGDWDFYGFARSGGFSLCPGDPGSIDLIDDLLGQLLPCFMSKRVNIGCDETADVGQGRSKEEVARRGGDDVYYEFLHKVSESARRHGGQPMFWADIALSHPESVERIPEGMIALAWGYEPDSPFSEWVERLVRVGRETWVCPGTSSWRSIVGRTTERRENLRAAAQAGAGKATGYLITDWGDVGHRQQWPVSLVGLTDGASRAWNPEADLDPRASSLHAFGDATLSVVPWLEELGDVDHALRQVGGTPTDTGERQRLRNATALFTDLHLPLSKASCVPDRSLWQETADRLRDLAARRPEPLEELLGAELDHTAQVAQLAADRACHRFDSKGNSAHSREQLAARCRDLLRQHRELWKQRSRPGGLVDSSRHYELILAELEA